MYKPRTLPLDPDSPAGIAAAAALGDILAEIRQTIRARKRLAANRASDAAPTKAA
jgi:hypothetical protein